MKQNKLTAHGSNVRRLARLPPTVVNVRCLSRLPQARTPPAAPAACSHNHRPTHQAPARQGRPKSRAPQPQRLLHVGTRRQHGVRRHVHVEPPAALALLLLPLQANCLLGAIYTHYARLHRRRRFAGGSTDLPRAAKRPHTRCPRHHNPRGLYGRNRIEDTSRGTGSVVVFDWSRVALESIRFRYRAAVHALRHLSGLGGDRAGQAASTRAATASRKGGV